MTAAPRPAAEALLEVEDLWVRFPSDRFRSDRGPSDRGPSDRGWVAAVRGVSFALGREKLGIVGESGSGKTTTGRAILGLVPPPAEVAARRLAFLGTELMGLGEAGMRRLRGRRISMILQDPKFSLNPVMTVGRQIAEVWRSHAGAPWRACRERALEMLAAAHIRDPERVYDSYPHQLSGGMGQRAMIAMMLIGEPDVLIADEPTSALDVTVRGQILAILDELVSRRGMGLVFITHDLGLVASFCDRVLVMYGGRILESCRADALGRAEHPYTRGLLQAQPRLGRPPGPLPVLRRDPAWLEGPDGEAPPNGEAPP